MSDWIPGRSINGEWVYKAGSDIIKAPFNTTKLDLMKKDLINIISRGSIIVGYNVINDDK